MQKIHIIIFTAGMLAGIGTDRILFADPADGLANRQHSQAIADQADARNKVLYGQ